jgi:hypothetical protein
MLEMAGAAFDFELVNDYRIKYVAYLDLLGFRQLVRRCGQDEGKREGGWSKSSFLAGQTLHTTD